MLEGLKIARALHREGAWNNPKVAEGSGSQRIVVRESDKLFIVGSCIIWIQEVLKLSFRIQQHYQQVIHPQSSCGRLQS
ncbi:MAG: hypothetical protein ACI87M_000225 [Yoonia sp.]|jgi:hypothetical protein